MCAYIGRKGILFKQNRDIEQLFYERLRTTDKTAIINLTFAVCFSPVVR